MKISKQLLTLAGGISFAMALFHVVLSFSPTLSEAFGAGGQLASNSPLLLVSGLVVAVVFAFCGVYALAGAGRIRRLPLLRVGLLAIGGLCTLNGLTFVLQMLTVLNLLPAAQPVTAQASLGTLAFLITGLLFLCGTLAGWRRLRPQARGYAAV